MMVAVQIGYTCLLVENEATASKLLSLLAKAAEIDHFYWHRGPGQKVKVIHSPVNIEIRTVPAGVEFVVGDPADTHTVNVTSPPGTDLVPVRRPRARTPNGRQRLLPWGK